MKTDRLFALNRERFGEGPVIYWMSRDQRAHDNWALIFAREMAADRGRPLGVVFCLVPEFLGAGRRQFAFMLEGLPVLRMQPDRHSRWGVTRKPCGPPAA
jgi:deoxyribodipyrimidine photo-lyase